MHKKWRKHLPYLIENVGKVSTQQIAKHLNVTEYELHLFLHRERLFKIEEKKNVCLKLIRAKFVYDEYFTPTRRFFDATGIRSRRWWQLYRGEKKMTEREYVALVKHLQISHKEALDVRQLDLFDNEL